jgi:alanyl-tRNA synthetase
MLSAEIRKSFIEYFTHREHREIPSASLVPAGDPTLLFTNAGMVQFKRVFQGLEKRHYRRAVTSQKCVRAGGKHNDLEQVGHTARHHTFFEMLGNFSFGDYFKKKAIEYAWEWVTSEQYLGIDPDRIYISVHHSDDEARKLWREVAGIADERIYGLGDEDNFWQMGETGPCGPCSEIYVDIRTVQGVGGTELPAVNRRLGTPGHVVNDSGSGRPSGRVAEGAEPRVDPRNHSPGIQRPAPSLPEFVQLSESGKLIEIWNLVFMQFDQQPDGSRVPLPAPSVDTGAGLERIAAVMQGVDSDYDTDLFMPIIERAREVIGKEYDRGSDGAGFRVLADHARAVAFLLADGVYPSSEGRGYVLRRILRRAVRHAYILGRTEPTLVHLADVVIDGLGDVYPELRDKKHHIESVTRAEEERFLETIGDGLKRLDELIAGSPGTIAGEDAFKLYDTYGFPVDLTQIIAEERGWRVDVAGFERALEEQRERSRLGRGQRAAGSVQRAAGGGKREAGSGRREGGRGFIRVVPRKRQRFVGYEMTEAETEILEYRRDGSRLELVLRESPFYSEAGGQVSDTGVVRGEGWELPVTEVHKAAGKQVVVGPYAGDFEPTRVEASVDRDRRRNIERNHTATHLAHAALREVLGDHVRQAGSVVAPDRLRFDFSHHAPVTEAQLAAIESEVNHGVWVNADVETRIMDYHAAVAAGAMALFGEKYGDRVRVVDIPDISMELCGGTHTRTTGQIGLFHFTGETGVAAGVRRIEAVTGPGAYSLVKELDTRVEQAAEALRTNPEHVARRIEQLLVEKRRLEKQLQQLLRETGTVKRDTSDEHAIGDVVLIIDSAPVADRDQIGLLMDRFREQHKQAVQVLFVSGDKAGIHVGVTDDLIARGVRAGDVANRIAAVSGGRGGGRPHFASAGAGDPAKLEDARREAPNVVRKLLTEVGV